MPIHEREVHCAMILGEMIERTVSLLGRVADPMSNLAELCRLGRGNDLFVGSLATTRNRHFRLGDGPSFIAAA